MLARGKISWSAEVISKVLHFKCSVITADCRNANFKTQDNTITTTNPLLQLLFVSLSMIYDLQTDYKAIKIK